MIAVIFYYVIVGSTGFFLALVPTYRIGSIGSYSVSLRILKCFPHFLKIWIFFVKYCRDAKPIFISMDLK